MNLSSAGNSAPLSQPAKGLMDYLETALPKIVLGPTLICRDGPVYRYSDVERWLEVAEL